MFDKTAIESLEQRDVENSGGAYEKETVAIWFEEDVRSIGWTDFVRDGRY